MWSRVAIGSTTTVGPSFAYRPASSTADFTCAEATGSVYVIGCSGSPAITCSGGQPSVSTIVAPISRSGIATRSTGRRRIDSSPSSVNVPSWPARMPTISRSSVPALPTSIGLSGARRPRRPTPWTRRRVGPSSSSSTRAPSCSTAATVERVSAPAPNPSTSTVPSARAPNSTARWETDLSPGGEISPTSALAGATRRTSSSSLTPRRRRRAVSRTPSSPARRGSRPSPPPRRGPRRRSRWCLRARA